MPVFFFWNALEMYSVIPRYFFCKKFSLFIGPFINFFEYPFLININAILKQSVRYLVLFIIFSLFFYGYWNPTFVPLILFFMLSSYYFIKNDVNLKISIPITLIPLFYFKYSLFIVLRLENRMDSTLQTNQRNWEKKDRRNCQCKQF